MADEQKPTEARGEATARKKGDGMLVPLLLLTLLAIAMGGGLGYLLAGSVESAVTARVAAAKPLKAGEEPMRYIGDLQLKELKAIVVNLAAPSSTFVRIEAAIIFKKGALTNPDVTAAEIRDDIVGYLRTLSLSQLEGPSALQHLREDLNDRAAVRSEGKVSELVLQSLVVQ